jgi:hypothetical protein
MLARQSIILLTTDVQKSTTHKTNPQVVNLQQQVAALEARLNALEGKK